MDLSDSKAGDSSPPPKPTLEGAIAKSADGKEAINASGGEMALVDKARTNASDGSLRNYTPELLNKLGTSIELQDGDVIVSRQNALTEKQLQDKPKAMSIEELSRSGHELNLEAKNNPVLEPVAQLRKYADSLPKGDQKNLFTKLSHDQARELSPEMKSRLEQREKIFEQIESANLEQAGAFKISDLNRTEVIAQNITREVPASEAGHPDFKKTAQHFAQLIRNHDY